MSPTSEQRTIFATGFWPYLILTLFCACLYLPGLASLPPTDRDEGRYVQATKQMLETGDFVNIRFQHHPYHKKPAGIQWLQGISVMAIGAADQQAIWPYRVPSVLGAWLAVLLTFAVGARLFDRTTGLLAAGFLGGSLLMTLQAHLATTDTVLLATVMAAQAILARLYMTARASPGARAAPGEHDPAPDAGAASLPRWAALVFWVAQGLGLLIKGPITPVISILTILGLMAWDRDWRWLRGLRPLIGLPVTLAIFLPWAVAVWFATDGGFYSESVGTDLLAKLVSGQEAHGAPPGLYVFLMLILFWPGSLFTWPALWQSWKDRTVSGVRFCLMWLVPAWLLFELVPTKLPHYVMPLYPALALLTARALLAATASLATMVGAKWVKTLHVLWAAVGIGLAIGAIGLPIVFGDGPSWLSLIPAAAALAAAILAVRLAWRQQIVAASVLAIAVGSIALPTMLEWVVPRLSTVWLTREVSKAVTAAMPERDTPVAIAGFSEPTNVFLLGTDTRLTNGDGAAQHLFDNPTTLVVVSDREEAAFQKHASAIGLRVRALGSVDGVNYSKGWQLRLTLYGTEK